MDRFRIVVDASLEGGAIAAQTGHGVTAFAVAHPEAFRAWHTGSNIIAILAAPAAKLAAIADRLEREGAKIARFHEPDLGGKLTAIALAPSRAARKATSNLPRAGAPPPKVIVAEAVA